MFQPNRIYRHKTSLDIDWKVHYVFEYGHVTRVFMYPIYRPEHKTIKGQYAADSDDYYIHADKFKDWTDVTNLY